MDKKKPHIIEVERILGDIGTVECNSRLEMMVAAKYILSIGESHPGKQTTLNIEREDRYLAIFMGSNFVILSAATMINVCHPQKLVKFKDFVQRMHTNKPRI